MAPPPASDHGDMNASHIAVPRHGRPQSGTSARARHPQPFAIALLIAAALCAQAHTEELWSESGFFIDLPEGFTLKEGDAKSRFAFVDPAGGMEFDLIAYEPGRFASVEAQARELLAKLGAKGEREPFVYEGREAVFAELSFALGGAPKRGYAVFVGARAAAQTGSGGAAARASEQSYALLAYADAPRFSAYADFIFSALDAFSIDRAARRSPGPVSQYLLPFPAPQGAEWRVVEFAGERIELPWNPDEAEQCMLTATREFKVLEAYGEAQEALWKAAWARCFRMIYRESLRRLGRLAAEFDRRLPEDPTEAARRILAWVQSFRYERDPSGIDFVDPLTAAYEGRGDCDSRALVMAMLLERRGIDTILMLSRDYAHAMAGIDVPGGGQRFPFAGKAWLVAETTARVGLGMIAASQADWKKWIGVELGE